MKHAKGASAPFFSYALCAPRTRDDALLSAALAAFEAGQFGDALLGAEYLCRRYPQQSIPAILRAQILLASRPELGSKAWYAAWCRDPENPALQDLMLQAWLAAGAVAAVADLGPTFLPARCRDNRHAALLTHLQAAGVRETGACWKAGAMIEGALFSASPRRRVVLVSETARYTVDVPADGTRFRLACPEPGAVWSLSFEDEAGAARMLHGSPLNFGAAPAAPAHAALPPARLPVCVIIPVYRDAALVRACIGSVLASLEHNTTPAQVLVVDDASPEPELSAWLDEQAAAGRIALLRNDCNLGFIETVNRALRACPHHDPMLLNADTLVHGDWIDRLAAALYRAPDVASVTPWSNNGEISSFPKIAKATPSPSLQQLARIDAAAAGLRAAGLTADVELPTCCGFTMLMRRAVVERIGVLDGVALTRGYGEEVDWCMRANAAGYRHLAATGVFVAHTGTVSFRFEKTLRVRQNRVVLAARYPHYHAQYERFLDDDPLAGARAALAATLEQNDWYRAARALIDGGTDASRALPAALPSLATRIAIWHHRAGTPHAGKVLALARQIAALGPERALRLLVIGDASEALWHTGVVDVVPSSVWQESTLLTDAAIVGLGGCAALLTASEDPVPLGMTAVRIDANFDPAAWLHAWLGKPRRATPKKVTHAA